MDQALLVFEQYLNRRFGHSSTAKHYLSDLRYFTRIVGPKLPETVRAVDVDAFVEYQIAAGLKPTTINRRLASLHTFFEYLASQQPERVWPNPVIARRHHLKTGHHLPRDVHDGDIQRLFAVITDARDRAIFGLMIGAGLRVGEVAALRLNNLEPPVTSEQLTKVRVQGKGDKERMVWLPPTLWETLRLWLSLRPPVAHDYLFLNHYGRPLTVSGIQYRLSQYSQATSVAVSCHRLRHTFARRLVEQGLPVDSLAKLLGHNQLQTTQRYIDGADPAVRADFQAAVRQLETPLTASVQPPVPLRPASASPQPRGAPQAQLDQLRQQLSAFPAWVAQALDAYLSYRWPTWRGQTAYQLGRNLISVVRRIWDWLAAHRHIEGWATFRRADLEAWLVARSQQGVTAVTIQNDLGQLATLLKFLEAHDYALDPGLFRVKPPRAGVSLPRYLPELDYRRLETVVLQATQAPTYSAAFDRAWFLALAHTGVRLSELLDWRLNDLNLLTGLAMVRGGKPGRDRVVYLTPPLIQSLVRYLHLRPDLPDDDHVFLLRERVPSARAIQRRLAGYGQQAAVEVSPHRLRHTLATRLVNRGMPITSLRKLLGHEHLNTTQIYAHIYDSTLYDQFRASMGGLEAIPVDEWPQLVEISAVGLDNSV